MVQITFVQLGFLPFQNKLKKLQSVYGEPPLALVVTHCSQAVFGRKPGNSLNSVVSV